MLFRYSRFLLKSLETQHRNELLWTVFLIPDRSAWKAACLKLNSLLFHLSPSQQETVLQISNIRHEMEFNRNTYFLLFIWLWPDEWRLQMWIAHLEVFSWNVNFIKISHPLRETPVSWRISSLWYIYISLNLPQNAAFWVEHSEIW